MTNKLGIACHNKQKKLIIDVLHQVFYAYTYGTGLWLGLQAAPLIIMPKLVITTLAEDGHQTSGKTK